MLKYVDKAFTFNSSNQQVKDHADYLVDRLNEAINLLMK